MENNNEEQIDVQQENAYQKKPKYKKKRFMIPIVGTVIALIVGGFYFQYAMSHVSTDDAYVEGHTVQIAPKIAGNVVKVYVDDNQIVKKGDLIAEIDSKDYQAKYDQIVAKLQAAIEKQKSASVNVGYTAITSSSEQGQASSAAAAAKASVNMSDKQISQSKAVLSQASQEVKSANAEFNLAQIEFTRYSNLFKKGAVSKQSYDKASTNYKTVKSKYNSALQKEAGTQASLEAAYASKEVAMKNLEQAVEKLKGANTVNQQVEMSSANHKVTVADIKELQAESRLARLNLSYTKIYAPQDGRITSKTVEPGSYVQVGQALLAIIPNKVWVIANFKETQLTNIRKGQPVEIKVDTYPNVKFKGTVDSIQFATGSQTSLFPPENAVGSFVKVVQRVPVKILFADKIDSRYHVVPGMSVIPEIKVK